MTPDRVKLQLTFTVGYLLNGESIECMKGYLEELVKYAVNRGLLTGESKAEVDGYTSAIHRLPCGINSRVSLGRAK
jgi:hypothetical protein